MTSTAVTRGLRSDARVDRGAVVVADDVAAAVRCAQRLHLARHARRVLEVPQWIAPLLACARGLCGVTSSGADRVERDDARVGDGAGGIGLRDRVVIGTDVASGESGEEQDCSHGNAEPRIPVEEFPEAVRQLGIGSSREDLGAKIFCGPALGGPSRELGREHLEQLRIARQIVRESSRDVCSAALVRRPLAIARHKVSDAIGPMLAATCCNAAELTPSVFTTTVTDRRLRAGAEHVGVSRAAVTSRHPAVSDASRKSFVLTSRCPPSTNYCSEVTNRTFTQH